MIREWEGFEPGNWYYHILVDDFIKTNYKPYYGDETFLNGISNKTDSVWSKCKDLLRKELERGVLDIDTTRVSGIDNYDAGYIDRDNEVIVGLQTDKPLKRIVNPYGGMRMVKNSLQAYGYKLDSNIDKYFNQYRKTHNQGVFDAYTDEMKLARKVGLLTGLPDAYGRGRIIGDYRRVALYGMDCLINLKKKDFKNLNGNMTEDLI